MLRSLKYGLYGAVLAAVAGAPVALANSDRHVHLLVDGVPRTVTSTASDVAGVLAEAGYDLRPQDLVAPGAASDVRDGSRIVLRRARLLRLDIDGEQARIWTTAGDVQTALVQLGYAQDSFVSVSRSRRLPLTPTDITIRTPKTFTVVHDGRRQEVTSTARTVGEMLADLDVTVRDGDLVSAPSGSVLQAGQTVTVTRVERRSVTRTKRLPFKTRNVLDPTLAAGRTRVVSAGKAGAVRISYVAIYVDGVLAQKSKPQTVLLRAARGRVVRVGTKPGPVAGPAASAMSPASSGADPSPATVQAYAHSLLPSYGWGDDQFSCLVTMWNRESGWRVHAQNPGSGAYGIPQALPGSKMGSGYQNSAEVQIRWGLGYIRSRYVSPCGAWSFWQAHNWY